MCVCAHARVNLPKLYCALPDFVTQDGKKRQQILGRKLMESVDLKRRQLWPTPIHPKQKPFPTDPSPAESKGHHPGNAGSPGSPRVRPPLAGRWHHPHPLQWGQGLKGPQAPSLIDSVSIEAHSHPSVTPGTALLSLAPRVSSERTFSS